MPTATHEEALNARAKLGEVVLKAKSDSAFQAKLDADPAGVLRSEGIPDLAIAELLKESGLAPEVTGLDYDIPCWTTCWFYTTLCTFTILWR